MTRVIRQSHASDHAAIRQIVADAFGSEAEADLVERIRASPEYESSMDLVAEVDDLGVVGHVMISRAMLQSPSDGERSIVMLSPLAVAPAVHGRGTGGDLVHSAHNARSLASASRVPSA